MAKMNFQPLYAQVRSALIARLTAGEWPPGAVLPGDSMLAAEMGVSPGTARKAVDSLVADGALRRHQGKGTFVTEQTPELANFHFFRLVDGDGERVLPEAAREVIVTAPAGARTAQLLQELLPRAHRRLRQEEPAQRRQRHHEAADQEEVRARPA